MPEDVSLGSVEIKNSSLNTEKAMSAGGSGGVVSNVETRVPGFIPKRSSAPYSFFFYVSISK